MIVKYSWILFPQKLYEYEYFNVQHVVWSYQKVAFIFLWVKTQLSDKDSLLILVFRVLYLKRKKRDFYTITLLSVRLYVCLSVCPSVPSVCLSVRQNHFYQMCRNQKMVIYVTREVLSYRNQYYHLV